MNRRQAITALMGLIGFTCAKPRRHNQRDIDFARSFAKVRDTVDASEREFAEMTNKFRELAREIPVKGAREFRDNMRRIGLDMTKIGGELSR